MPRRECSVMEERLRFVARLLEGEGMKVCREFGISRAPNQLIPSTRNHRFNAMRILNVD